MRGVHGQGLHTKFRSWRMGIPWNTPFWWTNHPWRPCLLCNVPYHSGMRCLAMLLHERIHALNVTWNLWLAMFIVCAACEFKGCTDHVPIVSNVSYSSVFGRDSLHVRPQLSDNIPDVPPAAVVSKFCPHWSPTVGIHLPRVTTCTCWALGSTRQSKCQIQLWPFTSYNYNPIYRMYNPIYNQL